MTIRRRGRVAVAAACVVLIVAMVGIWFTARSHLLTQDAPEDEVAQVPTPVLKRVDGEAPVQSLCAEPVSWASTVSHPALLAVQRFGGETNACVDVYRVLDEDPAKDYYQALVGASWVTWGLELRWPWSVQGEPEGELWVELTWDQRVAGRHWQTEWVQLEACPPEGAAELVTVPWADHYAPAAGLECLQSPVTIGQPLADEQQVTWSVVDPQELTGTGMLVEIAVPEGEVPLFDLEVRQVDLEG
ncbi:hypothetical protein [Demequina activiva]|uniref:hypothetical protein n=1 Tax=Demequina activiva TaxID=1582364 RepID=UPI001941D82D|nr:hypothetical protein [Demequina activiva]